MIKISRILKDYRDSGALNALVNVHAAIDERLFLTKSGELVAFLALQGPDYECLDASELDTVTRRFASAVRVFDDNFRIYQYLIKNDHPAIPSRSYDNPVVQEALETRNAYLQAKGGSLYSLETYLAVVYRPPGSVKTPAEVSAIL